MSNAAKLKKKAVELEQKKQFDKALSLYIQFLQESEGTLDDVDIPLYNRVGDMLLRTGNTADALSHYEKAVDLYAERGFHNNAIALCNKVLRQAPGRASIYYKLGRISATKGFKSDAKKNFLEYADRMQKTGQIDEAFRALKEFADLCPEEDDIRLLLAEQLKKQNRHDEAMEQLQKLHDRLDSEGRSAEARATADRMKSIDPEAVPQVSGSYRQQKSTDLIFLDTSFEQQTKQTTRPRERPAAPPPPLPAPPPPPSRPPSPPPGRQVSDPDLVVLTMADQLDASVSPAQNSAVADAFGLEDDAPNDAASAEPLPMLDVDEELPSAEDLEGGLEIAARASERAAITPLDFELPEAQPTTATAEPTASNATTPTNRTFDRVSGRIDAIDDQPAYVAGPPLTVDYASDLAADITETPGADFFDFRGPPRGDDDLMPVAPSVNLDPDVAFPSFEDTSLPSADEVTSGGSLAAALGGDATLGIDMGEFDLPREPGSAPSEAAAAAAAPTEVPPVEGLELGWSGATSGGPLTNEVALAASMDEMIAEDAADAESRRPTPLADLMAIDDLVDASPIHSDYARDDTHVADVEATTEPTGETEVVVPASAERRVTASVSMDVVAIDEPPASATDAPTERMAGWEVQRAHAERLLEAGDRAAGVQVLEQVAVELERVGDLERALTIVDELIRLSPDSVRHHQKRVELAFRLNDRAKLTEAYLELGDALFRSGEERKARAVYHRVLELAPDDLRARAAVESVSSMSPPTGSGAIETIFTPTPPATVRQEVAPTRPHARDLPARDMHARDTHARDMPARREPAASNGARGKNGIAAPPPSRKPSPLDRSAAPTGEFVDLGAWLRSGDSPKSTRMVAEDKPPTGDEQADFQEMLKRFKQGVAENVDDEDFESHYDLGVAYKEMGLMDEAVAEFQKALRGSSNRVRSYEALGQCFVEKEQYHVAASVLSRAIALGEGDDHHLVGVLYLLGRATEALSKHGDALDYYQRVFAVDIEFRDVAERISAIEGKAT